MAFFFPRLVIGRCMMAQPSENWRAPCQEPSMACTSHRADSTLSLVQYPLHWFCWHWHRSWHSSNRSRTRLLLTTINQRQPMVCPLNIPVSTLNSSGLSWRALGWAWLHPAFGWINVCRLCSRNKHGICVSAGPLQVETRSWWRCGTTRRARWPTWASATAAASPASQSPPTTGAWWAPVPTGPCSGGGTPTPPLPRVAVGCQENRG